MYGLDSSVAQIVQTFKNMCGDQEVTLSADDLKQPTADKLLNALNFLVQMTMGNGARTDYKQAPFSAFHQLTYPDLYDPGANEMQTYQNILELCWKVGLPHISIRHLLFPDPASTKEIFSSLLNFTLFHAQKIPLYKELEARDMEMSELYQTAKEECKNLEPEVEKLQAVFNKSIPAITAIEEETAALNAQTHLLSKEMAQLKEETKKLKEEAAKEDSQFASDKFVLTTMKQEIDKLRNQVIRSPEKLRSRLAEAEAAIEIKRKEVDEENSKLRAIQERRFVVNKVLNKMAKRLATAKDCEQEKKKAKDLHEQLRQSVYDSQKEEEKLQELKATAQHLERQLTSSQEKLANLQRQGEQKRVMAQQALDETERQKRELAYSIQQDKEQVKQNQSIIQRKEQEMQYLECAHKSEMDTLKKHYAQFAKNLRVYHSEIMAATCGVESSLLGSR